MDEAWGTKNAILEWTADRGSGLPVVYVAVAQQDNPLYRQMRVRLGSKVDEHLTRRLR